MIVQKDKTIKKTLSILQILFKFVFI